MAIDLAADTARMAALRQRLADKRRTMPLFDTERTTRHIERAYELAHERHMSGGRPCHLDVTAEDGEGREAA
jgi:predicted O-linked N-acetylglucosamine transferase (SPINDLY family)